jgi:hypothetical protein
MLPGINYAKLRTVTIRDFESFALHLPAWNRLAYEAPQKTPTLLAGWTDAFLRHRLASRETWFCSFAYIDDELVGVLPVIVAPHPVLGQSRPLLRVPFDEFTPSGDVLLKPNHAHAALRGLLEEVRRQAPGHLGLELRAIRYNSPLWESIEGGIDGYLTQKGQRSSYSYLNVAGSYENYLEGLGRLRSDLRRFHRKLEGRGVVTFQIQQEAGASEEFLNEFLALEASGWKGRNGTSISNDIRSVAFYTTLMRNFLADGRWEWQILRVDGRPVAAGMGVQCGEALMLPKFAFDESFADCRPGSLLTKEIIESAFSRSGISEVNPMSRLDWDCHWRMSRDEYIDLHLVRRSTLPMLFQLPAVTAKSIYHDQVKPRIPAAFKKAHDRFKRRGDRKPRRAADSKPNHLAVADQ